MSPTRSPAARLVALLALCLVAVLAPVTGPAAEHPAPVPASVGVARKRVASACSMGHASSAIAIFSLPAMWRPIATISSAV